MGPQAVVFVHACACACLCMCVCESKCPRTCVCVLSVGSGFIGSERIDFVFFKEVHH